MRREGWWLKPVKHCRLNRLKTKYSTSPSNCLNAVDSMEPCQSTELSQVLLAFVDNCELVRIVQKQAFYYTHRVAKLHNKLDQGMLVKTRLCLKLAYILASKPDQTVYDISLHLPTKCSSARQKNQNRNGCV